MKPEFMCHACDGPVEMTTGTGRTIEWRQGVYREIPEDLPIATCKECNEMYFTIDEAQELERAICSDATRNELSD